MSTEDSVDSYFSGEDYELPAALVIRTVCFAESKRQISRRIYVIEFSKNKGFGGFWDGTIETLDEYSGIDVKEENTGLLGVRMLKGVFDWEGQHGNFHYIGVNCYPKSSPSS